MATRYAVANGNWSNVATWDGGASLPGVDDDVYADGKTVTIDQNITVLSIRTTNRGGGTAGGSFTCAIAATINSNIIAGSTTCLTLTNTSGNNIVINGTITGGSTAAAIGVSHSTSGNVNVTGGITGGSATGCHGITSSGTGTWTVTGNITAGSLNSIGFFMNGAFTLNLTGDITGVSSNGAVTISGNCTLNQTGNVYGASVGASYGILIGNTTATLNITGNITARNAQAIYASSPSTLATCSIIGIVTSSNTKIGIDLNSSSSVLTINGNIVNTNGIMAIRAETLKLYSTSVMSWKFQNESLNDKYLYSAGVALGNPQTTDVRNGTTYGAASELTGTLIVPPPSSVALNVPTDNTVGTLEMTPADFWAYANRTLTANPGLTATDITNILTSYGVSKLLANDIAIALSTYSAAKTTDIPSISNLATKEDVQNIVIPNPDVEGALTTYGAAKTSDLAGIDIGAGLTAYGAAKTTDIINELKTSPEDVAERIRNLATVEAVGDIHST